MTDTPWIDPKTKLPNKDCWVKIKIDKKTKFEIDDAIYNYDNKCFCGTDGNFYENNRFISYGGDKLIKYSIVTPPITE